MPIVSCAINEMLLQSHEGAIRVSPAVPPSWHVRFELAAQGGFLVSAEHRDGKVLFVAITSHVGGPCRLVHPWPAGRTASVVSQGAQVPPRRTGEILEWDTRAGDRYIIVPDERMLDRWKIVPVSPARRQAPSKLKRAILGRDRLF
jgi:hypothetical protein